MVLWIRVLGVWMVRPAWRRSPAKGWRNIRLPATATEEERTRAAYSYYYETGDPGPLADVGVKMPDQQRARRAWKMAKELVAKLRRRV